MPDAVMTTKSVVFLFVFYEEGHEEFRGVIRVRLLQKVKNKKRKEKGKNRKGTKTEKILIVFQSYLLIIERNTYKHTMSVHELLPG